MENKKRIARKIILILDAVVLLLSISLTCYEKAMQTRLLSRRFKQPCPPYFIHCFCGASDSVYRSYPYLGRG